MDQLNPFFNTSTGTDKTKNALKIISNFLGQMNSFNELNSIILPIGIIYRSQPDRQTKSVNLTSDSK